MAKKKVTPIVLNDFNDIIALMEKNRKKAELERTILAIMLSICAVITAVVWYLIRKGY